MWNVRNLKMYKQPENQQPNHQIRVQQVKNLYERNYTHQKIATRLYKYTLPQLIKQSNKYLKIWITKARSLQEHIRAKKKQQSSSGQDIRKFL